MRKFAEILRRSPIWFFGCCCLLFCWSLALPPAAAALPERIPLTPSLLQERLNSPLLSEGILTLDLQHFSIDLTNENAAFREVFYQQLQGYLNRSKQPLGLDLSGSLIQGDFIASKVGLPTSLAPGALPQLLSPSEEKQLEKDPQFLSEAGEQITAVSVFRGPLKLQGTIWQGKVDFNKTFFLQRLEAVGVKFEQECNFEGARFARGVDFSRAIFEKDIIFEGDNFWGFTKFNQSQFQGIVNFSDSMFLERVDFAQSQFGKLTNFTRSQWLKNVDFSQSVWRDRGLFSQSHFWQIVSFFGSTFEKSIAFRAANFGQDLDFRDLKLLEQVDFSNASFFFNSSLQVSGLAFDSDRAKILGDPGAIGRLISLTESEGNETVIRNLVRNFRRLEQIADANQIEFKAETLKLQEISRQILGISQYKLPQGWQLAGVFQWLFLSLLLLLSNYGTNFSLVLGIGIVAIAYFGLIFWALDRCRRRLPTPILPSLWETLTMSGSFLGLILIGLTNIFRNSDRPWLTLLSLSIILLPLPACLIFRLLQQGRYHDLMEVSYFLLDGSMRQLRLLIVRLPVVPEFPFFRDRYNPLVWQRHWNWLNYYDFSCNNFLKLGFNDIRLREQALPGMICALVWYQWTLGILYIVLLLWTLSRTIPGLNLLIYLK